MASGLFGKWFGGGKSVSPQVEEALAELAKLTQPSLATACAVLAEMLPVLFAEPPAAAPPALDGVRSQERLAQGIPLLREVTVTLDEESLRRRWRGVCRAVKRQNASAKEVSEAFDGVGPGALLSEVLAGRPEAVHAKADSLQLDPALTATVLRLTLLPVLESIAAGLAPLRRQLSWDHGNCPTCGSWPLLGEFRGLEQLRFLRCGLCATDWEFPRLRCPFCDNRDHRRLGYFHVEGEENRCRAAACEECHGYVKMVSTLAALSGPRLLVADLATLHLDLAAADRGYLSP
jgi:FdhE protein